MFDQNNPTNIEILRIARDLAYSDYNNRKADLHNQWLRESDYMWRTKKLRVAYPSIPAYPTEQDILIRADKLLEFINRARPDLAEMVLPEPMQASETPVKQKEIQIAMDRVIETTISDTAIDKDESITVTETKDSGIIPTVKNFFKF